MGHGLWATCECSETICNIVESFMIGGGFANFTTRCGFPCLCKKCDSIVEANLLAKTPRCPKCKSTKIIPYNDPSLSDGSGKHSVSSWWAEELGRELVLTDGNYWCPLCKKMSLRFMPSGMDFD